jgi:hypothetical protein
MDVIPLEVLFPATLIILFIAIEFGYRAGNTHPQDLKKDKETITTTNAGAILGLLGFILVFTFGIVYSRYDSRRELVREEANMIGTAWLRSDFLPVEDRAEATKLFIRYVDLRLESVEINNMENVQMTIKELNRIQFQIWDMAVTTARKDMNSDIGALYIVSVNNMIDQQSRRIAIGLQSRIPAAMWVLLYLLAILGMFGVGYHASIAGSSRRSWLTPVMVVSFSLMVLLIASLDRPDSRIITVSQQPLVDLRNWMEEGIKRH